MNKRLQADLALAFCMLVWGATFVVVKDALSYASVFVFLAVRFSFAAVLMGIVSWNVLRRMDCATFVAGAMIGILMAAGYAFQTLGLKFTTPSKSGFINGSSVVLVPVLLAAFGRRRINRWVWAGALAALAGLYYLSVPAEGLAQLNKGDVLTLGAAFMFALQIIAVGAYSPKHAVTALSFLQIATLAVTASLAVPLLAATGWEPPRIIWTHALVFDICITVIGATVLCFSLQVWAQQYAPPAHTAILFSLEPVFAALTSFVVLHERLGARALWGAGLILAGILVAELKGPAPVAAES